MNIYPSTNKVIAVQGNLGAGKSTYLSFLCKKFPNLEVIREPVDEWQNIKGHNLLDLYYKDPKRWSFTFQTYAMMSRMKLWKEALRENSTSFKFSQRSMLADRHVFGELMAELQNALPIEMAAYQEISDEVLSSWPLHAVIYLKCRPQVCLTRIKRRNRTEEEDIPLDYLQKVNDKYTSMLTTNANLRVLQIDTEKYNVTDLEDQEKIANLVKEFMKSLE